MAVSIINTYRSFCPNLSIHSYSTTALLKKITGIVFAFLIRSVDYPVTHNREGVCPLQERASLEKFPDWYDRNIHPGLLSTDDGTRACEIPLRFPDPSNCDEIAKSIENLMINQNPEEYKKLKASAFKGKGAFAQFRTEKDEKISTIRVGTNPQKLENHKNALRYLEKNVLQNPSFFDQPPEEIVEMIKKTHKLMLKNFPSVHSDQSGKFRTEHAVVIEQRKDDSTDTLHTIMKKNGAEKGDIRAFDRSMKKISTYGSFEAAYKYLTDHEKRVHKFLGYIPPIPEEIEEKMENFARSLKKKGVGIKNGSEDGVEVAAWVHQELGNIHAFIDGNGRIARLWMNIILKLYGIEAIVFPSDAEYTEAIIKDRNHQRKFSDFLKEVIYWNQQQSELQPH